MELLSLTRSFFHLSYSNAGEESRLIPGSVSPEAGFGGKEVSAGCQRQRAPQQSLKGFQVVFVQYYDFLVTFIKPPLIHFQRTRTIVIQKLELTVIVLELIFNMSDMQGEL